MWVASVSFLRGSRQFFTVEESPAGAFQFEYGAGGGNRINGPKPKIDKITID
jgi:hypothetical protein